MPDSKIHMNCYSLCIFFGDILLLNNSSSECHMHETFITFILPIAWTPIVVSVYRDLFYHSFSFILIKYF